MTTGYVGASMTRRTFLGTCGIAAVAPALWAAPARRLKIGQIGTTHAHAAGKALAIRAFPETWDFVGVVEPDPSRRAQAQANKAFQGLPFVNEATLLDDPSVTAIAVETDMDVSGAAALRVLRAGKHVHLDKPGALHHAEYRALRREAQERGLLVQMGYMLRYNPAFVLMTRAVREGWLGEVLEIDATMGKLGSASDRALLATLPGGGMFELGCHLVDAVVTLLGEPLSVAATSTPSRDDGVKDNQLATLSYAKAAATLRVNFADPLGMSRRRFGIVGSAGALEIFPLESGNVKLTLTREAGGYGPGTHALALPRPGGRYDEEFVDLAKAIRGEKTFAWSAQHDIAVHATTLRASGVPLA